MMYVSANEKAVSLNLHRYNAGDGVVAPVRETGAQALAGRRRTVN
jgi:hypothetical protein